MWLYNIDKHRRYNIIKDYYLAGRSQCILLVRDIQIWCDIGSSSYKLENTEWNPGHLTNSCLEVWCDDSLTIWELKDWYSLPHHFKDQNIKRKLKPHDENLESPTSRVPGAKAYWARSATESFLTPDKMAPNNRLDDYSPRTSGVQKSCEKAYKANCHLHIMEK